MVAPLTTSYLLTGLVMEASYTISIVATSKHFFSGSDGFPTVTLGENVHVVYVTYAIYIHMSPLTVGATEDRECG